MSLIWRKQILCSKGATTSFFLGGGGGGGGSRMEILSWFFFKSQSLSDILFSLFSVLLHPGPFFFYINCHAVLSFGIVSRLTFFHSNLPVLPFFADCIQAPLKLEWHDSSLRLTQFHMHTNKPYVNVWYCKSFQITCSETLNLCGNLFQPWN